MPLVRFARLVITTLGLGLIACPAALAANNPFVRVDQDGNVYYGQVVGSASGSRFVTTCSRDSVRIEPEAVVQNSSRQCLDLSRFTGASLGPPPPSAPVATATTRPSAVLVSDPIAIVHYDGSGKPLAAAGGLVSEVGAARGQAVGDIAGALSLRLGVSVAWDPGSGTQTSELDRLCSAQHLVGVLVASAPRLELFDAGTGPRIANAYLNLRGYRCTDRVFEDVGTLAEGTRDATPGAWSDDEGTAAFKKLVTALRRQLIALVS